MKSFNNTSDEYDESMMKFTMKSFSCVNTTGIIAVLTTADASYKLLSIFCSVNIKKISYIY